MWTRSTRSTIGPLAVLPSVFVEDVLDDFVGHVLLAREEEIVHDSVARVAHRQGPRNEGKPSDVAEARAERFCDFFIVRLFDFVREEANLRCLEGR